MSGVSLIGYKRMGAGAGVPGLGLDRNSGGEREERVFFVLHVARGRSAGIFTAGPPSPPAAWGLS